VISRARTRSQTRVRRARGGVDDLPVAPKLAGVRGEAIRSTRLADPTIGAVVNLTPPLAHDRDRAVLEAGKAAFSEKPLGVS
jgi:hypothetical protein